ncbi:MAG: hypothetical protein OXT71_15810 [Acidobacteriota bacterium]|nr:hypothetical protein [Acidobacteriota bacterium]
MGVRIYGSVSLAGSLLLAAMVSGSAGGRSRPEATAASKILARECYSCHNQVKREGALSLHTFQTLMKGGNNGPPLVPGNSDESRMIQMVEGLLEPIMPEDGFLEDQDIETLRAWVDAGAPPWQGDLGRMRLERLPDIRPTETVRPEVASLAFHPQGTMVAAGSYEEIRLLRPGGGVDARLTGLAETVRSVAFSRDGSRLASGAGMPSRFGEIKIWDPATRQLVRSWEGHTDCIYSVAFSPDGSVLATAGYDRLVKLWEVTTGREIRTISGHVDAVYSLAFNASGDRLASASADRTVKVWDVASGRQLGTPLSGATAELFAMAFYPGGRRIAAAGMDKMIRIWDLGEEGGILAVSVFSHDGPVVDLSLTPDGNTLISAGADGRVKFWDADSLEERKALPAQPDTVLALAVSPSGETLAVGRYDGMVIFEPIP